MTVGSTGSGKSITAFDIAEGALLEKIPVLVLDPTGQWTGFLEKCDDKGLLAKYNEFGMKEPRAFDGRIFTPASDIGTPLEMNLLAKPATNDNSALQRYAIDVATIIKDFCRLTNEEEVNLKAKILETWKKGKDLDYKSVVDLADKDVTKKRLQDLEAASFLFEGKGTKISDTWKKGEISIISFTEIKSEKVEMFTAYYFLREVVNYFDSQNDSPKELKLLLVVEEAHRFTESNVWNMLDRAVKTMRKKGVGMLLVTQGLTDLEKIRGNTRMKIYMQILYDQDRDRAAQDIGREYAEMLDSLKPGTGIISYADFEIPVLARFRPCLHRNSGLTSEEIRKKMHGKKAT